MATAREAGINMAAFRAVVAEHRNARNLAQRLAGLEADDAEDFAAMCDALGAFGDTELGKAALQRAKPKGGENFDSLHS
jgi:hypothetical protein